MRTHMKRGQLISPRSKEEAVERCKQLKHEIEKITQQLGDTSRIVDRLRHPNEEHYEDWAKRAANRRRDFRRELHALEAWLSGWKAHEETGKVLVERVCDLLTLLRDDGALEEHEVPMVEEFVIRFAGNQPCPRCRAIDAGRKSGLCVTCSGLAQCS